VSQSAPNATPYATDEANTFDRPSGPLQRNRRFATKPANPAATAVGIAVDQSVVHLSPEGYASHD
jgi:hypothetical protein